MVDFICFLSCDSMQELMVWFEFCVIQLTLSLSFSLARAFTGLCNLLSIRVYIDDGEFDLLLLLILINLSHWLVYLSAGGCRAIEMILLLLFFLFKWLSIRWELDLRSIGSWVCMYVCVVCSVYGLSRAKHL